MDIALRDQAMDVERAIAPSSKSRNQRKKGKKGAIQQLLDESSLQGFNGAVGRSSVQSAGGFSSAGSEQQQRSKAAEGEQL